ncbi:hypothetical protein JCM8547_003022 [Rhodosporidiobolus lusitaniae]
MPTPRSTPTRTQPFSSLPRLVTSAVSSSPSSSLSSPGGGGQAGDSVPLLLSSRPATPIQRVPSRQNSLGSLSPSSPSPSAGFPLSPPPRAVRIGGSTRRWALLAGTALLGVILLGSWSAAGVEESEQGGEVGGLRETWRDGWEKVGSWTSWASAGEQDEGGGGGGGLGEVGEKTAEKVGASNKEELVRLEGGEGEEGWPSAAGEEGEAGQVGGKEEPYSEKEEGGPSTTTAAAAPEELEIDEAARMNVLPVPRPPPRDEVVARGKKYLSFENHSGFHNQRKSLVNALTLATLLNRTLLLPPARLGSPIPWGPEVNVRLTHSERCKAGLEHDPIALTSNSPHIGTTECDDPSKWTYVGWEYLVTPRLLEGRELVDRWNSSEEWFFAPLEEGGLGLAEEDVRRFEDPERRSYQIYDSPSTPTDKSGLFASRLELSDLLADERRLLRFGSLFSGARLKLSSEENQKVMIEANENLILQSEGLDGISDEVRDRLGSYVAAHARVGDGVFKNQARPNMLKVFRKLAHNVLGLSNKVIDQLLAEFQPSPPTKGKGGASHKSAPAPKKEGGQGGKGAKEKEKKRVARAFGATTPGGAESQDEVPDILFCDDEEEDDENPLDAFPSFLVSSPSFSLSRRSSLPSFASPSLAKRGPLTPLSPTLHCRSPLHPSSSGPSYLLPLNTPLYIATDSRSPTSDPALAPFFRWFPCVFLLEDFERVSEVNEEGVEGLEELVSGEDAGVGGEGEGGDVKGGKGGNRWTSEWDGQAMAKYLYPFLEAEIAARAVEIVGTPLSTFSGYTAGILHEAYVAQGMVAGWSDDA